MRKQASIIFVVLIVIGVAALYFANKNGDQTTEMESQIPSQVKVVDKPDYSQTNTQPEQATTSNTSEQVTVDKVKVNTKDWKLISGDANDTCTTPTFEGLASVRGFYMQDYTYPGPPEGKLFWAFAILPEDADKMPIDGIVNQQSGYIEVGIQNATKTLEAQWKKATKDHPATIDLNYFSTYCEGIPSVKIVR